MLSLSSILSQLNTMQQLVVERKLQEQVSYNSRSLLVFNCLMLGQNKAEIIQESMLNDRRYPIYERPIYNCILDLFELKPVSARDNVLSEVHYAIFEQDYKSDAEKVKALENLFHKLKRYKLEQESAVLLKELVYLSKGSHLHAVYNHLYKKYNNETNINEACYLGLQRLNEKISSYIDGNTQGLETKELVAEYKTIRNLHRKAENRTSATILTTSMLLLAAYCGQTQLLKEEQLSLEGLFIDCKNKIEELPFGIERYYLNNIYRQAAKYGIEELKLQLDSKAVLFSVGISNSQAPNFSFQVNERSIYTNRLKGDDVVANFMQRFSAFSIPQDSFSIRPNQI